MATIIRSPFRCTFIHAPKTGGNSITTWMKQNFLAEVSKREQHANIERAKARFGDLGWTFCVVRNPWDYMVSWYNFKIQLCNQYIENIKNNQIPKKSTKIKHNLEIQKSELKRLTDLGFNGWLRQTERLPQAHWSTGVDYVMKLENLNKDFEEVQQRLNCFKPLPYQNKTVDRPKNYRDAYNSELIDIVYKKYEIDIKTFRYEF